MDGRAMLAMTAVFHVNAVFTPAGMCLHRAVVYATWRIS